MKVLLPATRMLCVYCLAGAVLILGIEHFSSFANEGIRAGVEEYKMWIFLCGSAILVFALSKHVVKRLMSTGVFFSAEEEAHRQNEHKRLTEELVGVLNGVDQFSRVVSHHLRAPVANIMGLADVLQNVPIGTAESKELIGGIHVAALNLDTVIREMNTMLHLKFGDSGVVERFDINELVLDELDVLKERVAEVNADIFCRLSGIPMIMVGIRKHISSVLHELITNAIKFRDHTRKTEIVVGTYSCGDTITMYIKDNGCGFYSRKEQTKIYDMYYRIHTSVPGRGIGLFTVKSLVEKNNGSIRAYSRAGKGAIFKVVCRRDPL